MADAQSQWAELLLATLAEAGIASLDLTGSPTTAPNGRSPVRAVTSFTRSDGTAGMALDYQLLSQASRRVELIASASHLDSQTDIASSNSSAQVGMLVLGVVVAFAQR